MKNALILHGTNDNSKKNWFEWLSQQLQSKGYKTWVPNLPGSDRPNIKKYNEFIFSQNWKFNDESILIGHSSGAVEILGLLQALPDDVIVDRCYLVGSFIDNLGWEILDGLFEEPFDLPKIKTKANKFIFIHSDNDPYCPLDHAEYLSKELGGELVLVPGQQHFSIGTGGEQYSQFPLLLELLR
jgi:predicted alpha/beta hydrolase family esterase